jgi:hypothetical protein
MLILAVFCGSLPAAAAEKTDPHLDMQKNLAHVDFPAAWEMGYDGRGVRIAVIDSGVYAGHEDLAGSNILQGVNVIDRGSDTGDTRGHGTFIIAMLAAGRNNGLGISGMVDRASIVPIKCFSESQQTDSRYISSAIYMAVDEFSCDVINLSLGIVSDLPVLRQAVDYANSRGVIIVASAGNTGGTALVYPAAYPSVVGVGSVSGKNTSSYFSQRNESVFVVAPGENIISAGITDPAAYMDGSGTSFSAVHVTALAAVAKQYDRSIDAERFMRLLQQSATDLGPEGYDTTYGWGLVNTRAFLQELFKYDGRFADIEGHWAEEAIIQCIERGLFTGVSTDRFAPGDSVSRAMAATLLYRLAGSPEVNPSQDRFRDVPAGKWYSAAVEWAAESGIVAGYSDGTFRPDQAVTRQELAVILCRFAGTLRVDTAAGESPRFADAAAEIAAWARDAVGWCALTGLLTGRPGGLFDPQANATRAELASILVRYISLSAL